MLNEHTKNPLLDGAHQKDKDFAYFHLPPIHDWVPAGDTTLFGISCNRQIASKVF